MDKRLKGRLGVPFRLLCSGAARPGTGRILRLLPAEIVLLLVAVHLVFRLPGQLFDSGAPVLRPDGAHRQMGIVFLQLLQKPVHLPLKALPAVVKADCQEFVSADAVDQPGGEVLRQKLAGA